MQLRFFLMALASAVLLNSCSIDFVPVSTSRLKSAQRAENSALRGPGAPGSFHFIWNFNAAKGFLFDPSQVVFSDGVARFGGNGTETVVIAQSGPAFVALDSFKEKLGSKNQGIVRYQVSRDGSNWFYHDGKAWVPAGPTHQKANTAEEVSHGLAHFHTEVGTGNFRVKIFLVSPEGGGFAELENIEVAGIAPKMDEF